MAAVMELLLKSEISVDQIMNWMCSPHFSQDVSCEALSDLPHTRQEFMPYLLNYLRDKTLHLLQNSHVTTPSPAKPHIVKPDRHSTNQKCRNQLFSSSVNSESPRATDSLNSSLNSPIVKSGNVINNDSHKKRSDRKIDGHWKTPESCKFEGKFSLGDFMSESGDTGSYSKSINKTPGSSHSYRSLSEFESSLSKPPIRQGQKNKSKSHGKIQKNLGQEFSCFSNDFPVLGGGDAKPIATKPSRRISPTPILHDTKRHHVTTLTQLPQVPEQTPTSPPFSQQMPGNDSALCLEQERLLLRQEKAKHQLAAKKTPTPTNTPHKPCLDRTASITDVTPASLSEVTHHEQVECLAELYSQCLHEKLLPNITVELYFLVQLLTSRGPDQSYFDDLATWEGDTDCNYLSSLHNAVYFSVIVLEQHISLLSMLDRCTLRLLSENPRVRDFSPNLTQLLTKAYESSCNKAVTTSISSPIPSVSFQADTDNRKNFPTEQAFHVFKKQRDGFYELIREWELNHTTPGWSMMDKMRDRIQGLLSSKTDLSNYIHFARLFQSQLIATCKSDGQLKIGGDEENITLLMQLKRSNPDKFKRLQERFVTPLSTGTPCPTPTFPGCQEFFHDFIYVASSPVFNQHLTDSFSHKITRLNELQLADVGVDFDRQADAVSQEDREHFTSTLLNLRLLAKFLGYVTFLPYQSKEKIPDTVMPSCLKLRSKLSLPLDLHTTLHTAWTQGRLCLTLPWITQLLSMMDYMAARVEEIRRVLQLLVNIYRNVCREMRSGPTTNHQLLIVLSLGWLFELPSFPEGMFFQAILEPIPQAPSGASSKENLDQQQLVDQQLLYTCCPYIGEIRSLLLQFAMGSQGRSTTIRKITPISADVPSHAATEQQIQNELEESFFHNHPASLKRVVEFTADRTASNYIKMFRNCQLQTTLSDGRMRVGGMVRKIAESSPCQSAKERAQRKVQEVSQEIQTTLRGYVFSSCPQFCSDTCTKVMPLLLPVEQTTPVVSMATDICRRQAEEKVTQWMAKHISHKMLCDELSNELQKQWKAVMLGKVAPSLATPPDVTQMLCDELSNELQKQWKAVMLGKVAPSLGAPPDSTRTTLPAVHHDDTTSPTDLLVQLKECAARLALQQGVSRDQVCDLLQRVVDAVTKRQDVLAEVTSLYQQLTVDISVLSLSYNAETWTTDLNTQCTRVLALAPCGSLHTWLVSPRVVYSMQNSHNSQVSWSLLTDLIAQCIQCDLVLPTQVLQQVLQCLDLDIPHEVKNRLFALRDSLKPPVTKTTIHSTRSLPPHNAPVQEQTNCENLSSHDSPLNRRLNMNSESNLNHGSNSACDQKSYSTTNNDQNVPSNCQQKNSKSDRVSNSRCFAVSQNVSTITDSALSNEKGHVVKKSDKNENMSTILEDLTNYDMPNKWTVKDMNMIL